MVASTDSDRPADTKGIFAFELDFAGTLRCIPMVVRFKLDRCGVKLSLRQWSRFNREERAELVARPCDSEIAVQQYRDRLVRLIATRAGSAAELMAPDTAPVWNDPDRVPERLVAWAEGLGVAAPKPTEWARLEPLQRFALYKLTRPGHDNDNFLPAMREFDLAP